VIRASGAEAHVLPDLGDAVGANGIASWWATSGLTEAARRGMLALLAAGASLAIEDVDISAPQDPNRLPAALRALRKGRPFPIDLCFVNVNELQLLSDDYLSEGEHYRIGSWYWELPQIPDAVQHQLKRVNEIWVASTFVKDAFAQYTSAHIEVMPCVVEPLADPVVRLSDYSVPTGRCVFFFNFDANSTFARKNPWGVIEAFRRAFTKAERRDEVHLVVKTINLDRFEEGKIELEHAVETVGGTLINRDVSAGAMAAIVAQSDIYVSLHRAEGFGLGLAEAMYFGRPVIATAYSGNLDFTTAANSCQVGYKIRPITEHELRFNPNAEDLYQPGLLWADPDLDQAVRWMRLLFADPALRERVGSAGQETVRSRLSTEKVGAAMTTRLREVTAQLLTGRERPVLPASPSSSLSGA
jgi:glycosyltransferase involved in cell wall biosynthesis